MKLMNIITEDFVNYKVPSMYLVFPYCSFKCNQDCGECVCQNYDVQSTPIIDIDKEHVCEMYLANDITKAICLMGFEPFDSPFDLIAFVDCLRTKYKCEDDIVIYTGYTEFECLGIKQYSYKNAVDQKVLTQVYNELQSYPNIVIKFGRFIPNREKKFDEVLGITLASDNQYAKRIS